jgi:hypothetical protein
MSKLMLARDDAGAGRLNKAGYKQAIERMTRITLRMREVCPRCATKWLSQAP